MTRSLPFAKMHGCENDYVVLAASDVPAGANSGVWARELCTAGAHLGADGLLVVGWSEQSDGTFQPTMDMWNPDGSPSAMCGNGLRCAIRFAVEQGAPACREGIARTAAGKHPFAVHAAGRADDVGMPWDIAVDLGVPTGLGVATLPELELTVHTVELGNPHAVLFVDDVERVDLVEVGPQIETHAAFPNRTNVELVARIDESTLRQRTWERGAGETRACGSGAAAAVIAATRAGWLDGVGTVRLDGGELHVRWPGPNSGVWLRGPAAHVAAGTLVLRSDAEGDLAHG